MSETQQTEPAMSLEEFKAKYGEAKVIQLLDPVTEEPSGNWMTFFVPKADGDDAV